MRAKEKLTNRIITFFLVLLTFFSMTASSIFTARAEEKIYPFDETNVLEDLESSESFNLNEWPWDYYGLFKSPQIMNFVEWCYSPFNPEDFALYIYFYNPLNLKIDVDNPSNRIQMASLYDSYPITRDSLPVQYDTYSLVFCNKSERANYEGLFYKFRIVDEKGADGLFIKDRVYAGERRYDVSGVIFAYEDGTREELGVGGTYYFNGFAAGYGPDESAESTLENSGFTPLETITLEVHPTVYRQAGFNQYGEGHQWDINSVYFSVPERYFTEYGSLQKIKAEWWEYETEPIFLAKNTNTYNILSKRINVPTEKIVSGIPTYSQWLSLGQVSTVGGFGVNYNTNITDKTKSGRIDNIFWVRQTDDGKLSKSVLENYMMTYDKSANKGYLPIELNGKKISADLVKDGLYKGRADVPYVDDDMHHKVVEIDANDKFDMNVWGSYDDGFISKTFKRLYGFEVDTIKDQVKDITPIISNIDESYLSFSDSNLSKALLINKDDASKFKSFYNTAKNNKERTVLFRFAMTDYFCTDMYTVTENTKFVDDNFFGIHDDITAVKGEDLAVAWESMFLDFKIIHLTFQAEGEYTVIPVVSDPIDIINDITPQPKGEPNNWWDKILDFLKSLGRFLGAWIVLIVGVVAILFAIRAILKLLAIITNINNAALQLALTIAVIVAAVVAGIFVVKWWIELIIAMGGLGW